MERYICIHGHFYQPPRENPWLEEIELQDSAYPYHDWNERITAECYATNAVSRILDGQGRIMDMVNNYTKISFNFGPTLLSWLRRKASEVYQAIIEADRKSQNTFSDHGSALAQAYSHMILPLANRRDKYTQILWGIKDFEYHFGRSPEGMWLPETAVDLETLDIMAELGIKFTILTPRQASRVRRIGEVTWRDVTGGRIDPTMAYEVRLSARRKMSLFFYDDPIARSVAFEGLLSQGETFAQRLMSAFNETRTWPQLVHVATDGETYGHHHKFGDMALAYALHQIESSNTVHLTNYGEYLEKCPPTHQVEIIENTSWSCAHGVERWRSDCGCSTGGEPKWNQAWRAPLRAALDYLRDNLAPRYEKKAAELLKDPWAARDDYIAVVNDRSPENVAEFLNRNALRKLDYADGVTVLKLMELQRHAMLMYTSCGWFFSELSGIETMQLIQYAARVVQLAQEVFGYGVETRFVNLLEQAKSNLPQYGDGRQIYQRFIKPTMVDLNKVTAHYAISSLFEEYDKKTKIYFYNIERERHQVFEAGVARLAVGLVTIASEITTESDTLSFGVLHIGDHNLNAGVRQYKDEEEYRTMVQETTQAFSTAEFPDVIRQLDKHFGTSTYSLRSLFRDEQRNILDLILECNLAEVEAAYRQVYEHHYPLMRFLTELRNPLPKSFHAAAEFIINADLRTVISGTTFDKERIAGLLGKAWGWKVQIDTEGLSYLFKQTIEGVMAAFVSEPKDLSLLKKVIAAAELARSLPFHINLWKVQNLYYEMLWANYPSFQKKAKKGDEGAVAWVAQFKSLGEYLSIRAT